MISDGGVIDTIIHVMKQVYLGLRRYTRRPGLAIPMNIS